MQRDFEPDPRRSVIHRLTLGLAVFLLVGFLVADIIDNFLLHDFEVGTGTLRLGVCHVLMPVLSAALLGQILPHGFGTKFLHHFDELLHRRLVFGSGVAMRVDIIHQPQLLAPQEVDPLLFGIPVIPDVQYLIADLPSDQIADGSEASGYPTNIEIFKALCPNEAPLDMYKNQ